MEFLVFIIYGILAGEWLLKNRLVFNTKKAEIRFYKSLGFFNMLFGMTGIQLFNVYLRDTEMIPSWAFWTGFAGFAIVMFLGGYFISKEGDK